MPFQTTKANSNSKNAEQKSSKITVPLTQDQELIKVYGELKKEITEESKKAKQDGKKFFILLAESHASPKSLLVETMVADIVHRLDPERNNVGRILLEINPTDYQNALKGSMDGHAQFMTAFASRTLRLPVTPIDREVRNEVREIYKKAREGDKAAQDKFASIVTQELSERDKLFAKTIKESNGGEIILGAMHVKGTLENLKDARDIKILRYNITGLEPKTDEKLHPLLAFALDRKNMKPISLSTVPEDLPADEILPLTLTAIRGNK